MKVKLPVVSCGIVNFITHTTIPVMAGNAL